MIAAPTCEFLPLEKPRLKALIDHLGVVKDPRDPRRVAHSLREILFLVVCATICGCDNYEAITLWGKEHVSFLRRYLPYHFGTPGERWLTIVMNRINPQLFSAAFTSWVRETWPQKPDFVAIDGKTSRRSHDRSAGKAPLHLVSAFATTARLVLGQEAVSDKSNEITAIPALIDRLSANDGLKGAVVSIDAMGTNATIATAIIDAGADYLLAVKANQPTLKAEIERYFEDAPHSVIDQTTDLDKAHGRIEERCVTVSAETDWLNGQRRFPGELRLPKATTIIRVTARTTLKDRCRFDTRYYIASATMSAKDAAKAVRGHWQIENALHWTLDVTFNEDQSRLRKGHGATNMAIVRHFAINLARMAQEPVPPQPSNLKPGRKSPAKPKAISLKLKRKVAGWNASYLETILGNLNR